MDELHFITFVDRKHRTRIDFVHLAVDFVHRAVPSLLSLKLLNFWRHETRLPNSTIERFIEILRALYSTKTEREVNMVFLFVSVVDSYTQR